MELVQGTIIDRYRVETEIGRGGMARVYRVRHKNLDTLHALKVLTAASHEQRERLMREGRLQSQFDHPNIVPVRDVLDLEYGPGLLMDYIDGPSLDRWLVEEQSDAALRHQIFSKVLEAVDFAHQQGIVHRDLKPGNILMARKHDRWVPMVADFGLAKLVAPETDSPLQSRTGRPMGTPAYMSPEQVRSSKHVDQRADIFALGCILYELICGQRAFIGPDSLEVFNRVAQGHFRAPRDLSPDLDPNLEQAILGSLAIRLEDRIPDCVTLREVMEGKRTWDVYRGPAATLMPDDLFDLPPGASSTLSSPHGFAPPDTPAQSQAVPTEDPMSEAPAPTQVEPTMLPPSEAPRDQGRMGAMGVLGAILVCVGVWWMANATTPSDPSSQTAPPSSDASTDRSPGQAIPAVDLEVDNAPEAATATSVPPPAPRRREAPPEQTADPEDAPPPTPFPEPTAPADRPSSTPNSLHQTGVSVSGNARLVRLVDAQGTRHDIGQVQPGSYLIEAAFDAGPPMHAGNLVLREGTSVHLNCQAASFSCSQQEVEP